MSFGGSHLLKYTKKKSPSQNGSVSKWGWGSGEHAAKPDNLSLTPQDPHGGNCPLTSTYVHTHTNKYD